MHALLVLLLALPLAGEVRSAASGAPVSGAAVSSGAASTTTDADGRFRLEIEGPGELEVTAAGFLPARRRVEAAVSHLVVELLEKDRFREEVVVSADGEAPGERGVLPVSPRRVLEVAGGVENVFRVVQLLPGVAGTDEFDGRLAVRGGSPDQNLTVLDGIEIHNPYRLFGLVSAFNPETVQSFELTAGAFDASHGDRLSSLLVVRQRPGTEARRLAGSAGLSATDGNLLLEGRLPRGAGSWLVTTRRTYYDLVAERFVDDDLPSFEDVQAKLSWQPRPGHRLALTGLRSRESADSVFEGDRPGEQGAFVTGARNDVAGLTWEATLGARGVARTVVATSENADAVDVDARFRNTARRSNAPGEDDGFVLANVVFERELGIRDLSARHEVSVQAGRHVVEAGAELHRLRTRVAWTITGDRNPSEGNGSSVRGGASLPDALTSALGSTRWGTWIQDRVSITDTLVLEPGLRLEGSSVNRSLSLQPRLAATLRAGGTRLRAAVGWHQQTAGYEKLVTSDYFLDLSHAGTLQLGNERAFQAVLAAERSLGPVAVRAEAYYKRLEDLVVGALETGAQREARVAAYDFPAPLASSVPAARQITTAPTNDGRGRAYGLDLLATLPADRRVTGWVSYTLGRAERTAYGRTFPFEYDRRHAVAAVAQWQAGRRFDVTATARVASGFPRTPVAGLRVAAVPDARGRLVPERDAEGRLVYTIDLGGVGDLLSARLPAFARLDLRATFRPRGPQGRWSFYVDVLNATNRRNAGAIDPQLAYDPASDRPRVVEERSLSIPLLPSVGVHVRF